MNPVIVSTEASRYFAELLSKKLDIPILDINRKTFGGGERYHRLDIDKRNELFDRDVIIVGSTHDDKSFDEVCRIGEALAMLGTRRRIFVIPFFGYSTMEREQLAGEFVVAKMRAKSLSQISGASNNIFLLMDLHVAGLVHYFEGDCVRHELYAEPILVPEIRKILTEKKVTAHKVATTDLGRPLWTRVIAEKTGAEGMALVTKERDGEETKIIGVIGDVDGFYIFLHDDMNRSSKTLVNAGKAYAEMGARGMSGAVTHLALNNEAAITKTINSPIEILIGMNTHPMSQHPMIQESNRFRVLDASGIFSNFIDELLS
jgi:ribose-phosphate pyrophosphokinase